MNELTLDDLEESLVPVRQQRDPAQIGYSPTLVVELALRDFTPEQLRVEYGYTREDWDALKTNEAFVADLSAACEMVRAEGMSFKLKAKLQAEELLTTSWRLIHGGDKVPATVKADLVKATMRWAGYDNKEATNANLGATGLNIQINL